MAQEGDVVIEIMGSEAITVQPGNATSVSVTHDPNPPGTYVLGSGRVWVGSSAPTGAATGDIWLQLP